MCWPYGTTSRSSSGMSHSSDSDSPDELRYQLLSRAPKLVASQPLDFPEVAESNENDNFTFVPNTSSSKPRLGIHENFEKQFDNFGNEIPLNTASNSSTTAMPQEQSEMSMNDVFNRLLASQSETNAKLDRQDTQQLEIKTKLETQQEVINTKLDKQQLELQLFKQQQIETLAEMEQRIENKIPELIEMSLQARNVDPNGILNTSFAIPRGQSTSIGESSIADQRTSRVSFAEGSKPPSTPSSVDNRVNSNDASPRLIPNPNKKTFRSSSSRNSTFSLSISKLPSMGRDLSDVQCIKLTTCGHLLNTWTNSKPPSADSLMTKKGQSDFRIISR